MHHITDHPLQYKMDDSTLIVSTLLGKSISMMRVKWKKVTTFRSTVAQCQSLRFEIKGPQFESQRRHCVMTLSKTHHHLLCITLTQEKVPTGQTH